MKHRLMIPSVLYTGVGSIAESIKEIIEKEQAKKVLVFTDQGIIGAGLLDLLLDPLKDHGTAYEIFSDLRPEPSYEDVEKIRRQAENSEGDLIVAFGGGSVMDAAKLVSILKGSDYSVKDLLANPSLGRKRGNSDYLRNWIGSNLQCDRSSSGRGSKKGNCKHCNDPGLCHSGCAGHKKVTEVDRSSNRSRCIGSCGRMLHFKKGNSIE